MYRPILLLIMTVFCANFIAFSQPNLKDELIAFSKIPAVSGRENEAADFILGRLQGLNPKVDALGNITLTIGSGSPHLLFTAPLDEPGYVITDIPENGFLRFAPVYPAPWTTRTMYLEGHKCIIQTEKGHLYGAITFQSSHFAVVRKESFEQGPLFKWQDGYIDVGASSKDEVMEMGIRLMDPILPEKIPSLVSGERFAAPSSAVKGAAIALAGAARQLIKAPGSGTITFAWNTLELINGKGLESVVNKCGPFDEAYVFSRCFEDNNNAEEASGGILVDQKINSLIPVKVQNHTPCFQHAQSDGPLWGKAKVVYMGLGTRFKDTPVETINLKDVNELSNFWLSVANGKVKKVNPLPLPAKAQTPDFTEYKTLSESLSKLVDVYGVSGYEKPVRDYILTQLPKWAKPEIIDRNIAFTIGKGEEHIVFVAHMDEVGYAVDSIGPDGRLVLKTVGGVLKWLWEGQTALVHTSNGDIPAVFEPRKEYANAQKRSTKDPLIVWFGAKNKEEAERLGIEPGKTSVTMPKQMSRIGKYRVLAKGFDDRAGDAVLLQAINKIDPSKLHKKITFCFSIEEEIALTGAKTLAKVFKDATRVYPVDTFVSSDDPVEPHNYAYCPLGKGAILRVFENINFVPRDEVKRTVAIADKNNLVLQMGYTMGGTDGQPFLAYGIPSVPLSWPGRYSHSPIEVLDLRDLDQLVKMVVGIAEN